MRLQAIILSLVLLLSCENDNSNAMNTTFDQHEGAYLALGDSYTIGEAVPLENNFPYQLAAKLKASGIDVGKPEIIATTGWTTDELQAGIRERNVQRKFKLVTLLIGVNNQYRGGSIAIYREEFKALLATALAYAGGNKLHVFVVSIPDWGVTPFGISSGRGQQQIGDEIDAFNAVNKAEALAAGISYTDITPGSRKALTESDLVASDGLHPSAKMYTNWVEALYPAVLQALK